jgi:phosphoserine phosphatase
MDRPVLDLANDLFKGKGVCCEPTADALGQAVQRAADEHPGSGHDERVAQFTGWLLTHHLVTLDPMNCGWRIARDAIDELLEQLHLPRVVRRAVQVAQWQARTGRTSLEDDLAASPTMTVLVDFDHTLLLGNSTEVFLDTARPRWLALLLNAVARWLWRKPVIRSLLGRIERDHFRVLVVACLLPWTLPLWRWTGRRLGDRLLNRRLVELVSTPDRRVITVSNGFARIIRPMLRGAGLDWPLVSSGLHPTRPTVRAEGKEAAVARAFPELNLHRTIGVSDSMEDAPFLAACGTGHLRQWPDRWSIAPAYMPFRFTGQAKYNISGLVWQVFTVDLPLVVLAWASSLPHALGMALLFTAMHIVYEWGYWDNQYGRLSSEPRRKRHPAHNRFLAYPIKRMGVLWHIVLAGGGLALLGQLLPVSVGLWAAAMVAMWVTFLIFNRLPHVGRLLTYPLLQCFKYGAYAVVVGVPDVVGLAILTTLVLWQTVHYWAYRLGFNERSLPRIVPRLVLFAGLAIAGHAILDKQLPDTDFWPRFWLLLAVLAMTGKAWFHATRLVAPRAKAVWWRLVRGPLHRMVKAAHHTVSSPHVCYMPFFGNDTSACTDHWSRGAWYLPKVDGVLDRVVFGCSPGLNPGSPPRWMGDYTESTGHFDIVRSRFALLLQLLRARVIVQWKGGANNWIESCSGLGARS